MEPIEGAIFISNHDGKVYVAKQIVHEMVILQLKEGGKPILVGLETLESSFRKDGNPKEDDKLEGKKEGVERRKHARFLVKENATASLHDGFVKIGKVRDVSMGGLSFEYIQAVDEASNRESLERNIFLFAKRFSLGQVPCREIYDLPAHTPDNQPSLKFIITRRCCVEFQLLSESQKMQLEFFLRTYTTQTAP